MGVESHPYALDARLKTAAAWIKVRDGAHRRTIHEFGDDEDATPEAEETTREVIYIAGSEVVNKALSVNADAVIVVTGLLFDPRLYILLARAGIPVFTFGTESPYNDTFYEAMVSMVAAFSTNEAASVPKLQAIVKERGGDTRVMHLPLGFDPARHYRGVGQDADFEAHDVVFVGNMYPSRRETMEQIDWCGVNLGLYGVFIGMPPESHLWQWVKGTATADQPFMPIDNRATAALYDRAKIVLNMFRREEYGKTWSDVRTVDGGQSINPRLIEAAAMGAFIISEYRPEVETVFGKLVPTFKTPAEAQALIRYYLDHDDEREAIRAQLPAVVAGYSYHVRARQIVDVLTDVRAAMLKR